MGKNIEIKDEYDHTGTDQPICPHCGHVHHDAYEWRGEDGEAECEDCGKPFDWSLMIIQRYTTKATHKTEPEGQPCEEQ